MDLERALALLAADEAVGLPTDTVYGIAANPASKVAVQKLFAIKGRGLGNPIGLLVADLEAALSVAAIPPYARAWAEQHWPGPLNLIGTPLVELEVGTHDSLAVRVPDHETALELLRAFGPLAVTSANIAGGAETCSELEAESVLGDLVAYYVPGRCSGGVASTAVDVRGSEPVLLRVGPIEVI
jgi:L-threonylcarbamoyladenylate synthase